MSLITQFLCLKNSDQGIFLTNIMSDSEIGFWGGISQHSSPANALTCSAQDQFCPFFQLKFWHRCKHVHSRYDIYAYFVTSTHYLGCSVFNWHSWQNWKLFVFLVHEHGFLVYVWMALCDVGTGTCWRPYWHKHICGGWGSQPARNLACCPLPCFTELVYLYCFFLYLSIKSSILISHGHRWLKPSQYNLWLASSQKMGKMESQITCVS